MRRFLCKSYVIQGDRLTFIFSLGSTEQTRNDTWRMIWEAGISNIVMVTNLMEDSKVCFLCVYANSAQHCKPIVCKIFLPNFGAWYIIIIIIRALRDCIPLSRPKV